MHITNSIYHEVITALESGIPFALGIISGHKGATSQKQDAKALFFEDGRIAGALGSGYLETEIRKRALEVIRQNEPAQFDLVLDHDSGSDDALICGGKVSCLLLPNPNALPIFRELAPRDRVRSWGVTPDFEIILCEGTTAQLLYRETLFPREQLWIAGAGHVARALAPLASFVDFEVTVFDDRPAVADPKLFPAGTRLRVDHWDTLLDESLPSIPTIGLVLIRDHQHDARVLSKWLAKPFAFLGMIGSRRKRSVIFNEFIEKGITTKEQLDRVACPVGLPIGDVTVEEIALSITAQLVLNRSERRISLDAARNIRSPSLIKARAA